jgi:hypothetical protein
MNPCSRTRASSRLIMRRHMSLCGMDQRITIGAPRSHSRKNDSCARRMPGVLVEAGLSPRRRHFGKKCARRDPRIMRAEPLERSPVEGPDERRRRGRDGSAADPGGVLAAAIAGHRGQHKTSLGLVGSGRFLVAGRVRGAAGTLGRCRFGHGDKRWLGGTGRVGGHGHTMGLGPGKPFGRRKAAATSPALFGMRTTAGPMLTRERLAAVFGQLRRRQRVAANGCQVGQQRGRHHRSPPGSASQCSNSSNQQ